MSHSIQVSYARSPARSAAMSITKILLVDDDPQLRRVLRMTLTSAGYIVIEAATGEESLEKIQAEGVVDVVLLDLKMPGMGGIETCRRIRKIADIPILVISVRCDRRDKMRASEAGAADYLVKPFGIQDLLLRIHALRRRTPVLESIPTV
jgi:two-component system, OmpR family, KDP operon response regulator KdpE